MSASPAENLPEKNAEPEDAAENDAALKGDRQKPARGERKKAKKSQNKIRIVRALDKTARSEGSEDAPRPLNTFEISSMLDAAEAAHTVRAAKKTARGDIFNNLSFGILWGALVVGVVTIGFLAFSVGGFAGVGLTLATAFALVSGLILMASALKVSSPLLLAGAVWRRASGKSAEKAVQLAGSEILTALGIADKVLDGDPDPRLVTRCDGAVTYANAAYFALAKKAGVMSAAGLPPRIDRLFAQQGSEATKVFRLCRAAKSAAPAEEVIYQTIGLDGGGERRRFEVSVRPIEADDYVAWRLRELPMEEKHDSLAAAFVDFVRPVFALEKSGQIAWTNAAMCKRLGVERGAIRHIDDVVLGETGPLVAKLWQIDHAPAQARIRRRKADPLDAEFIAFRHGGVGEGFVCVELNPDEEARETAPPSISGDVSEAPFGVAIVEGEIGRDAKIIVANKAFTEVFGGGKKNAPLSRSFTAETMGELAEEIRRKAAAGGPPRTIDAIVGEGAAARAFCVYARPVRRRRGSYGTRRTFLYTVDVTERKRMQEAHAQDQKLKAIGHLAGEVAHDFNNFLQVVLGSCEQLMLRHPAGDPAYQDLVQIRENAQRAANRTKQLLAYSRSQTLKPTVQSITDILLDFSPFLGRAGGEKVKIDFSNGRGLPPVKVDRNQLETAIMNLVVNARDAMAPRGGKITIRTKIISAGELKDQQITGLSDQDHVLIEVIDTGPGVPVEIVDRIFDPFFTTKGEGEGTGLGLSTVHGIIGQMGGAIMLENAAPGATGNSGAIFRVYLPAYEGGPEEDESDIADEAPVRRAPEGYSGTGRILVVEDEGPVRTFVVATLERGGYEVASAEDGVEALEILEDDRDFNLIISDVMMPEIDGPTFVQRAREEFDLNPAVIFMSGYAQSAVRDQLDKIDGAGYIQKPFPMASLGEIVKEALYAAEADKVDG